MAVRAAIKAVALSGLGATLIGCGGGDTTAAPTDAPGPAPATPAPAPAPWPNSIKAVWDNHFGAFAAGDVDMIMKDYDSESLLAIFNDKCDGSKDAEPVVGYQEYAGEAAIRGFFEALFTRLKAVDPSGSPLNNISAVGPIQPNGQSGSPSETYTSDIAGSSVFLTWRTAGLPDPIDLATDTFTFRQNGSSAYKIWKQNIVATEPLQNCVDNGKKAADLKNCTTGHKTCDGWNNHFGAFGGQNLDDIMKDYSDESLVQVYDNNGNNNTGVYSSFKGKTAIRGMFDQLFKDLGPNATGLGVKVLDVDESRNTVFLVWTSDSHPKATDTFIFDTNGIILTQTIVVSQNASFTPPSFKVMI